MKISDRKKLIHTNFNFVMYFIFSALFFVVSLGFTYLIELVSKIAVEGQHDLITAAVVWLAVYAAVSFGIRYGFLYFRKKACCKWNMDVKTGLMNNILARSPAAFKEKDRTYYMSLFNDDIGFLQKNYVEMIADMVTQMTTFVIALIYAMNINILFTVLILAAGAISVLVTNKLSAQASKHNKTYMDVLGSYNEAIDDGLRGYPVIYKSNALKNFMKLFNERTKMNEKYHAILTRRRHIRAEKRMGRFFISLIKHSRIHTALLGCHINQVSVIIMNTELCCKLFCDFLTAAAVFTSDCNYNILTHMYPPFPVRKVVSVTIYIITHNRQKRQLKH